MVKKISVFITILGLFLVGIPQFNSKANADTASFTFQNGYSDGSQYNLDKYSNLVDLSTQGYVDMTDFFIDNTYAGDFFRFVVASIRDNITGDYYYEFSIIDDTNSTVWRLTSGGYVSTNALGINTVLDFKLLKNTDFLNGYNEGYNQGYNDAREEFGYWDWVNDAWRTAQEHADIAYDNGYDGGWSEGYFAGLEETDATGFTALLTTVFGGLAGLLAIEILPNIHIGAIIAVPLVFGIIFFILGKRKGD